MTEMTMDLSLNAAHRYTVIDETTGEQFAVRRDTRAAAPASLMVPAKPKRRGRR
jgi:hypothetical protein